MFYILLLYVHSCFSIILMGKRESWLLCLVCLPGARDCCEAIPLSAMGLSAVCYCDTYCFWVSFMRTVMAFATFAWSSLSLRHTLKFSCGDSNGD